MLSQDKIKIMFDEVKNGDFVGFHYPKWYYIFGKIIYYTCYAFIRRKKLAIEHVGQVFNVERKDDLVVFSFGEQKVSTSGKTISIYTISRFLYDGKMVYHIDSGFDHGQLHYLPLNTPITDKENEFLQSFWQEKDNYSLLDAASSVNFIEKIIKFFGKYSNVKHDKFCSGSCHATMLMLNRTTNEEMLNPVEFAMQPYLNVRF